MSLKRLKRVFFVGIDFLTPLAKQIYFVLFKNIMS